VTAPVLEASPVVDASLSTAGERSGLISAPMVAAQEGAWAAIRARHPEVPAVVMVLGVCSIGVTGGGLKLGHFAAMWWADPDQSAAGDGAPTSDPFNLWAQGLTLRGRPGLSLLDATEFDQGSNSVITMMANLIESWNGS
jgi:hypothetical protein